MRKRPLRNPTRNKYSKDLRLRKPRQKYLPACDEGGACYQHIVKQYYLVGQRLRQLGFAEADSRRKDIRSRTIITQMRWIAGMYRFE